MNLEVDIVMDCIGQSVDVDLVMKSQHFLHLLKIVNVERMDML